MRHEILPERIEGCILVLRGHKVLLSSDIARLYDVKSKALVQAVKRNIDRFPDDFMFQLNQEEMMTLARSRSQIVTLKRGQNAKYPPYAFTEQGVAMLSSVLRSRRAAQVNIAIMRAFVKLRRILSTHEDLARKLSEMERKYDIQFKAVFDAIHELMMPTEPPARRIGFHSRRTG